MRGDTRIVGTVAAARMPQELLDALERIDDGRLPIAEVARRLNAEADARGRTRTSYERIRQLVHSTRELRTHSGPSRTRVLLEGGAGLRTLGSVKDAMVAPRSERR